jgi:hypothetical protein
LLLLLLESSGCAFSMVPLKTEQDHPEYTASGFKEQQQQQQQQQRQQARPSEGKEGCMQAR